jgi:hypothetical protein
MDKESQVSNVPTPATEKDKQPQSGLNRRTLLRVGGGAAPVLLSLASSPVSATTACTVASSFVSVATFKSRNPHVTSIQCSAGGMMDANYWKLFIYNSNPVPAHLVVAVHALLGNTGSTYNANTLQHVLQLPQATGPIETTGELGTLQHLITLALHYNAGNLTSAGVFNLAYIQGIWANYKSNGNRYKLPASNIDWGDTELIAWLRFLMNPITLP